jgi:hypothetical protein
MLEFLAWRGEVAVAGRQGRQRLWDVSEHIYPGKLKVVPAAKAKTMRDQRRLRALGVARPEYVGEAGIPVEIEGTTGEWRVDPDASAAGFKGRTAILSPFDRLIHDRTRASQLFGFDYTLEMYSTANGVGATASRAPRRRARGQGRRDRRPQDVDARINAIHEDVAFHRHDEVGGRRARVTASMARAEQVTR